MSGKREPSPIETEAAQLLERLGFDDERTNARSALTFLALVGLRPGDSWSSAADPLIGVTEIMEWIGEHFGLVYKPNTRETIRRRTLHQFEQAHLIVENPDEPSRPKNSPKYCYQIGPSAIEVIRLWGTDQFEVFIENYLEARPGLKATYRREREMDLIPVTLPSGRQLALSPGGQNPLIKAMIDDFGPRFCPGGEVLYVGDAGAKWLVFEEETLAGLGVSVDSHGKMPDLVVYMEDRNWLVLLEAASSHGPVDHTRHIELKQLFGGCTAGLVFVSCFSDLPSMRKYFTEIAWETDAWAADHPTHLVHFNGERFLGPYD